MNLLSITSALEDNDSLHLARILILIDAFSIQGEKGVIEGLTKLAKLDFLLRYPVYLERALLIHKNRGNDVKIREHERKSVESSMVRYKYGPWDFRYRRFLNILVSKKLVRVNLRGRSIEIQITDRGRTIAENLIRQDAFVDIAERAKILRKYFNYSPSYLVKLIYDTFPEIGTLRLGKEIEL